MDSPHKTIALIYLKLDLKYNLKYINVIKFKYNSKKVPYQKSKPMIFIDVDFKFCLCIKANEFIHTYIHTVKIVFGFILSFGIFCFG